MSVHGRKNQKPTLIIYENKKRRLENCEFIQIIYKIKLDKSDFFVQKRENITEKHFNLTLINQDDIILFA